MTEPALIPASAYAPQGRFTLPGASSGPLSGLRFAAKDNFDVAGHVTGAGSPDWRATHAAATATAVAVQRLLDAGATLVGKSQMDALAWGSLGDNPHYGAPPNPNAPDRLPGGSSSGSASLVAAGEVDFALGSDTACSVRLPAAACGVFGFRPTHGRVDMRGLIPAAPSLDTIGWFARDGATLARVGAQLLAGEPVRAQLRSLRLARDAFSLATPASAARVRGAARALHERFDDVAEIEVGTPDAALALYWLRAWSIEVREFWQLHGAWIGEAQPRSQMLTRDHFREAAESSPEHESEARAHFARLRARLRELIPPGVVLCLPTAADVAPLRASTREERGLFSHASLCLLSIAGIGGLPQLQIPIEDGAGPPIGLSLVGAPGSDEALLELAAGTPPGRNSGV